MITFFMALSVCFAIFSCVCAWYTVSMHRAHERMLERERMLMAEQAQPDQSHPSGYQDLSSSPRYREYGDLS